MFARGTSLFGSGLHLEQSPTSEWHSSDGLVLGHLDFPVVESDLSRRTPALRDYSTEAALAQSKLEVERSSFIDQSQNLVAWKDFDKAEMTKHLQPIAASVKHRQKWKEHWNKLPVRGTRAKQEIVGAARGSPVSLVSGDPGTGKTTQVPQLLLEAFKKQRVILVEPHRALASAVAKRLRLETGEDERIVCSTTDGQAPRSASLIVTPAEDFLRTLAISPNLTGVAVIIVDECHERFLMTDYLLSQLKSSCRQQALSQIPFVLLSGSAAFDKKLDDFEESCKKVVVTFDQVASPNEPLSLEALCGWLQIPSNRLPQECTDDELCAARSRIEVVDILQRLDDNFGPTEWSSTWGELIVQTVGKFLDSTPGDTSAVAITVPTSFYARRCAHLLSRLANRVTVVVLHAESHACIEECYKPQAAGKRMVLIICTDFLSQSIPSVPIYCLIDCCRTATHRFEAGSHGFTLQLEVSTSLARSRAAKIDSKAVVFNLLPSDLLRRTEPSRAINPFLRTGFSHVELLCLLHAALFNETDFPVLPSVQSSFLCAPRNKFFLSRECFFSAEIVQSLRDDEISRLVNYLDQRLAVQGMVSDSGSLTPLGWLSLSLPVPLPVARLIVFATLLNVSNEALTLAAIWIEGSCFVGQSELDDLAARDAKRFLAQGFSSDSTSDLNLFKTIELTQRDAPDDIQDLYESTGVSQEAVEAVFRTRRFITQVLHERNWVKEEPKWIPDVGSEELDACGQGPLIQFCIAAALYPNVLTIKRNCEAQIPSGSSLTGVPTLPKERVTACPPLLTGLSPNASSVVDITVIEKPDCPIDTSCTVAMFGSRQQSSTRATILNQVQLSTALPIVLVGQNVRCVPEASAAPASRCRGWYNALSTAWRQTAAARPLPPAPQVQSKVIPVQLSDAVQSRAAICIADNVISFTTTDVAGSLLEPLRTGIRLALRTLLLDPASLRTDDRPTAPSNLLESLEWAVLRELGSDEWSRERRKLVAAKPRVKIISPFVFSNVPGRATGQDLHELKKGVIPTVETTGNSDNQDVVQRSSKFRGPLPTDPETRTWIEKAVEMVAKRGDREKEKELLRAHPKNLAFLDLRHEYHGYYIHRLKKEAPQIKCLGDDLGELKKFLLDLEEEIKREVGASDPVPISAPQKKLIVEEVEESDLVHPIQTEEVDVGASSRPIQKAPPMFSDAPLLSSAAVAPVNTQSDISADLLAAVTAPTHNADAEVPSHSTATLFVPYPGWQPGMWVPPNWSALSIPPPPMNYDESTPRPPSVLVSPMPKKAVNATDNLPLILAKALGETLNIKVGPTLIVGDVARIDVPNKAVEQRAVDVLKSFYCLGVSLKIERNDRIFDNAVLHGRAALKLTNIKRQLKTEHPRHLQKVEYEEDTREKDFYRPNSFPVQQPIHPPQQAANAHVDAQLYTAGQRPSHNVVIQGKIDERRGDPFARR